MTILVVAAVLPGLVLLFDVYRLDKIEKEPRGLIVKLLILGALTTITAVILESIGVSVLGSAASTDSIVYKILENYCVVACAEELGKYLVLKKVTWKHPAFDYRFDAIVYAVSVGLGFAILENIEYVLMYGMATALVRAVTAVPAHTIFAIFMGHYYGEAKLASDQGDTRRMKSFLRRAYWVPVFLHGTYDFFAGGDSWFGYAFLIFVVVIDVMAFRRVRQYAKEDTMV